MLFSKATIKQQCAFSPFETPPESIERKNGRRSIFEHVEIKKIETTVVPDSRRNQIFFRIISLLGALEGFTIRTNTLLPMTDSP